MSVLVNFAIFPTDKGTSISPYVARVERAIRALGFTRVYCTATFDIKQSPMGRMQAKVKSVESKI